MPAWQGPADTAGPASAKIIYSTKTSRERATVWGGGEERWGGALGHVFKVGGGTPHKMQLNPRLPSPTQQCPLFGGLNPPPSWPH